MLDQLSKNIARCGLSNSTLNYLRVSVQEKGGMQASSWSGMDLGRPPLLLRGARCLAALGCGGAMGQALQEGSCRWAAENHGAVGLLGPGAS